MMWADSILYCVVTGIIAGVSIYGSRVARSTGFLLLGLAFLVRTLTTLISILLPMASFDMDSGETRMYVTYYLGTGGRWLEILLVAGGVVLLCRELVQRRA